MNLGSIASVGCGLLLLAFLTTPERPDNAQPRGGRYLGAAACKNCHNTADQGKVFDVWLQTPHARAYETLATAKAKAVGKELGVDNPQQSDKCLQCHVTAFGVDEKQLGVNFKREMGVQCESCHGAGGDHQKKRMAKKPDEDPAPVTADEIVTDRSMAVCGRCHNEKSPTFKPFCLKERMAKIEHYDPRKQRSEEELGKLRETCSPDCKVCKEKAGDGK